jgi:hypothetical protein
MIFYACQGKNTTAAPAKFSLQKTILSFIDFLSLNSDNSCFVLSNFSFYPI